MYKSQTQNVLDYMKRHSEGITPLDALSKFGCLRLASIICELRKRGHDIETAYPKEGKRYAIYRLRGEE